MKKLQILLAASLVVVATTLTSCVKDNESASVEAIRGAKAEQLKALASMQTAMGQAALIQANADKVLKEAEAELKKAEAALKNAEAEYQNTKTEQAKVVLERAKLELSKIKATIDAEIATLIAQAEKAKLEAERQLKELIDGYKLADAEQSNQYLNKLIYLYSLEINHYHALTSNLIEAKHTLALNKSNWNLWNPGLEQLQMIKETEIALNNTDISSKKKAIEILKAIKLDNMPAVKVQMEEMQENAMKFEAEKVKLGNDISLATYNFTKSRNSWNANKYKQALDYLNQNMIPIWYVSYQPDRTDGKIGEWTQEYQKLATTEYVSARWKADEKKLVDNNTVGNYYVKGLIDGYYNTYVDMPAFNHAVSQMNLLVGDVTLIKNEKKAAWNDAIKVEAEELSKLNEFVKKDNIDAEFAKWNKLKVDFEAAWTKYISEQNKLYDETYPKAYATCNEAEYKAWQKYYESSMTPEDYQVCMMEIQTARQVLETTIKTQIEIVEVANENQSKAFEIWNNESTLLSYGYIQPYLISIRASAMAAIDYFNVSASLVSVTENYKFFNDKLTVLKSEDAKKAYEAALQKVLDDNKTYQVLSFDKDVSVRNYEISSSMYYSLFNIYSGYVSIKDEITAIEAYIAEKEQANADYYAIENKEALVALNEKEVALFETKIAICKELCDKYKAMIDQEMAK